MKFIFLIIFPPFLTGFFSGVVVVGCGWESEDAEQVGAVMAAGLGIHRGSHSVVIFVLRHRDSQHMQPNS